MYPGYTGRHRTWFPAAKLTRATSLCLILVRSVLQQNPVSLAGLANQSDHTVILVIGGTRGTGLLIAQLLERRGVAVRVLARNPEGARCTFGASVDIVVGDITQAHTLPRAFDGVTHVIFTAGCRSGYPATEALIRATEYEGVIST